MSTSIVVRPNYAANTTWNVSSSPFNSYQNYQAIVNGQSTVTSDAQPNNGPVTSYADTINGTNPQSKIDGASNTNSALRFPSELPRYYMSLSISDYKRDDWKSIGSTTETGRIILPMPNQMIDNQNIRYEIEPIGVVGALSMDAFGKAGNAIRSGNYSDAAIKAAGGAAESIQKGWKDSLLGTAAKNLGNAGAGFAAAAGMTVNDFMTVMVKGPSYKSREFVWRFSPQSADESETLRKIIQLTNNSSAVSLVGVASMFFKWPSIWNLSFEYADGSRDIGKQTFRTKPAILNNATFNYTPNGVWSPYAGTGAPESVEVRFSFIELEYWLKGDYHD